MGLLEQVDKVKDFRDARGIRHPISAIIKSVILGFLAGLTCIEHIAKYISEVWEEVAEELGFTHWHPPDGDTYRRILSGIESSVLTGVFEDWISERLKEKTFDVAVDGKACRGVVAEGKPAGKGLQLLNVFAHDIQVVLTQWPLPNKKGEPTVLKDNLAALVSKYPGLRLLTMDAAFSGRNLCQAIMDLHKDYLIRIKGNQPDIQEALGLWFDERLKSHGKPDAKTLEKKGA